MFLGDLPDHEAGDGDRHQDVDQDGVAADVQPFVVVGRRRGRIGQEPNGQDHHEEHDDSGRRDAGPEVIHEP